jgi:hypothetical protein
LAEPDDVALPAVFLALDDSRWISDELILVAGREWIILRSVIVHGCAGFGRQVINWQLQAFSRIESFRKEAAEAVVHGLFKVLLAAEISLGRQY